MQQSLSTKAQLSNEMERMKTDILLQMFNAKDETRNEAQFELRQLQDDRAQHLRELQVEQSQIDAELESKDYKADVVKHMPQGLALQAADLEQLENQMKAFGEGFSKEDMQQMIRLNPSVMASRFGFKSPSDFEGFMRSRGGQAMQTIMKLRVITQQRYEMAQQQANLEQYYQKQSLLKAILLFYAGRASAKLAEHIKANDEIIENLEAETNQHDKELEALAQEKESIQANIAGYESLIDYFDGEIERLTQEQSQLTQDINQLDADINDVDQQIHTARQSYVDRVTGNRDNPETQRMLSQVDETARQSLSEEDSQAFIQGKDQHEDRMHQLLHSDERMVVAEGGEERELQAQKLDAEIEQIENHQSSLGQLLPALPDQMHLYDYAARVDYHLTTCKQTKEVCMRERVWFDENGHHTEDPQRAMTSFSAEELQGQHVIPGPDGEFYLIDKEAHVALKQELEINNPDAEDLRIAKTEEGELLVLKPGQNLENVLKNDSEKEAAIKLAKDLKVTPTIENNPSQQPPRSRMYHHCSPEGMDALLHRKTNLTSTRQERSARLETVRTELTGLREKRAEAEVGLQTHKELLKVKNQELAQKLSPEDIQELSATLGQSIDAIEMGGGGDELALNNALQSLDRFKSHTPEPTPEGAKALDRIEELLEEMRQGKTLSSDEVKELKTNVKSLEASLTSRVELAKEAEKTPGPQQRTAPSPLHTTPSPFK